MRVIALMLAVFSQARADDKKYDVDLGEILKGDPVYKGIEFFWIRENKREKMNLGDGLPESKEFKALKDLLTYYATKLGLDHLSVGERVRILHDLIAYRKGEQGSKLWEHAFKTIRTSPKTEYMPGDFKSCTGKNANNVKGKLDPTGTYKRCQTPDPDNKAVSYDLQEIKAMASEVVYTVYLKWVLARHSTDAKLLKKCKPPKKEDNKRVDDGFDKKLLELAGEKAAETKCSHRKKAEIAVKVNNIVMDSETQQLNSINIAFVRQHPMDTSSVLGIPQEWSTDDTKKCWKAALEWLVKELVDAEAKSSCGAITIDNSNVPPTLDQILLQTYSSAEHVESSATWGTLILGGSAGALFTWITYLTVRRLRSHVAVSEE